MIAAESHIPLVVSIVQSFRGMDDMDDLIQVGSVGLLKAAAAYDENTGMAFSTFAVPRIRGAVVDYLRKRYGDWRYSRRVTEVPLSDHFCGDRNLEARILSRIDLERALPALTQEQLEVVRRFFYQGDRLEEIGDAMGVTGSRVCQVKRQALDKLRRAM